MTPGTVTKARCCIPGGWVVLAWATIPLVRPCPVHRPEQHQRWAAGEYQPSQPVEAEWHGRLALVR